MFVFRKVRTRNFAAWLGLVPRQFSSGGGVKTENARGDRIGQQDGANDMGQVDQE